MRESTAPVRHIAIIGSGPAGYYSAEAAQKKFGEDVRVDIIDRLPVPLWTDPFRRRAGPSVDQGSVGPL
jgi:2-polyprenyl-6-methoxyphenol hydroxylase-like FAD-dependent oxidoreductase